MLAAPTAFAADDQAVFFENRVRPLLAEHCYSCHSVKAGKDRGGLLLDSRDAALKGGDLGAAIVPGNPEASLLIRAVRYTDDDLAMPPKKKLDKELVAALEQWVRLGAPWPAQAKTKPTLDSDPHRGATKPGDGSDYKVAAESLWSLKPITNPATPDAKLPSGKDWSEHPVDRFVLRRLNAAKLQPSPPIDRASLLRRVYFDLIGLPPTYEQVQAFLVDKSPEAFEKVVDRLLADPRYGERWARHWLDVARYADTKGYVGDTADNRYPFGYSYRDYVIRAFNESKPFDRFIIEQIAADKLGLAANDENLAAMGFLTLGRRFINRRDEIIDDRIDVVTRGLMGLAVQCARCHDHPHDPISAEDYYALYGVFRSSKEPEYPPQIGAEPDTEAYRKFKAELDKRRNAISEYKQKLGRPPNQGERNHIRKLERKVNQWIIQSKDAPPHAMVLEDGRPYSPYVFLRGKPSARGPQVSRRFLEVLSHVDGGKSYDTGSGRLEMAKAIANPANPLTARVFVNRVWLHHFGQGIVGTPDDFGHAGDKPSHPELLDHLAHWFVENDWSVKKLHRHLLLSKTYQQASLSRPDAEQIDPQNTLLWRMNRRRLELEPFRDSMLFVSGRLDKTMYGPGVDIFSASATRRSVYGWVDRQKLPGVFRVFDFASPDASTGKRPNTMVPQRALYMLNNDFVKEQSTSIANAIMKHEQDKDRAIALWRQVLTREPSGEELEATITFVREAGNNLEAWRRAAHALLMSNEFAFID